MKSARIFRMMLIPIEKHSPLPLQNHLHGHCYQRDTPLLYFTVWKRAVQPDTKYGYNYPWKNPSSDTSILLRVFCIQYIKYVQNYPVRYSIKISHRIPLCLVFFVPILSREVLRYCFGALILVVLFGAYQLWRLFFSRDLGNTTESIIFWDFFFRQREVCKTK